MTTRTGAYEVLDQLDPAGELQQQVLKELTTWPEAKLDALIDMLGRLWDCDCEHE